MGHVEKAMRWDHSCPWYRARPLAGRGASWVNFRTQKCWFREWMGSWINQCIRKPSLNSIPKASWSHCSGLGPQDTWRDSVAFQAVHKEKEAGRNGEIRLPFITTAGSVDQLKWSALTVVGGYADELRKGAHTQEFKGYDRGDVPGKRGQQATLRLILSYADDQLQAKDILTLNLLRNLFLWSRNEKYQPK